MKKEDYVPPFAPPPISVNTLAFNEPTVMQETTDSFQY